MARDGSSVVVKNTFLEIGDHESLLEMSDTWRRQVSEPVKIYTERENRAGDDSPAGRALGGEGLLGDEGLLGGLGLGAFASGAPHFPGRSQPSASSGGCGPAGPEAPQVLLLSETLPARRERPGGGCGAKGGGSRGGVVAGGDDRPVNRRKDTLSQMKNNDITKMEPPWADVTTVMMRNLPNKYTQQMLLEELADGGFQLKTDFDFFYLPMDHSNAANLGYCFINFCQTTMANAFESAFGGKRMRRFNSNKTVVVMPASMQGYDKNYAYYSSTRVVQATELAYRPLFMKHMQHGADGGTKGAAQNAQSLGGGPSGMTKAGGKGKKGSDDGAAGRDRKGQKGKGKDAMGLGKGREAAMGMGFGAPGGCSPWTGMMQDAVPGHGQEGMGMMQAAGMGMGMGMVQGMGMGGPGVGMLHEAAPPFVGMAVPPQAQQPRMVTCQNCGNECSGEHRFCAFCGSAIGGCAGGADGSSTRTTPQHAAAMSQHASAMSQHAAAMPQMRQAAPEFMMPWGGGPLGPSLGPSQPFNRAAAAPWQQHHGFEAPDESGAWPGAPAAPPAQVSGDSYYDSVNDELDVVRGRMMLLAALKDMESREAAGGC